MNIIKGDTTGKPLFRASELPGDAVAGELSTWGTDDFHLKCEHCEKSSTHFYAGGGYCKEDYILYAVEDGKKIIEEERKNHEKPRS